MESHLNDEFTKDQTTFWGALAGLFWCVRAYLNYKQAKLSQKEENKMEKAGIKETKEVLDGLSDLGAFIIEKAKDGLQAQDGIDIVTKIMLDPAFKEKMDLMVSGIQNVPAEIKDLDISEGFDLIKEGYEGYKQIIEALKK